MCYGYRDADEDGCFRSTEGNYGFICDTGSSDCIVSLCNSHHENSSPGYVYNSVPGNDPDDNDAGVSSCTAEICGNGVDEDCDRVDGIAPVITQETSVSATMNEDGSWSPPTISATDGNGDSLTWSKTSGPSHGSATVTGSGASPTITYTPGPNYYGSDDFGVQVTDGTCSPDTITVNVMVNAVNDAPTFTKGADQTVNEDAGAQTVPGWATAISSGPNESQTLTFNATNNNNALFSVQPAVNATTGNLTYTPAANMNGSATVTVTLSDNGGTANSGVDTSAAQTFTITINAVNDAPSFTASNPPAVSEDAGAQTVSGWAAFNPGAGNESAQTVLAYTVSNVSNPSLFSAGPSADTSGNLTYTPVANASGTSTFDVTVRDNGGGTDTSTAQSFTITVNAVNDPPANDTIPTFSGNMAVGQLLTALPGTWNDTADSGTIATISYQWQRADDGSGTGLADISDETNSTYTLQAADIGKYIRVKVTATDSGTPGSASADEYSDYKGVPTVTTGAESAVGTTSATFNGTVNAKDNASVANIRFQYGTTAGYGLTINASPASASGNSDTAVSATPADLGAGIVYHYRTVAAVDGVNVSGDDRTFTTSEMAEPGNALSFNGSNYVSANLFTAATDNVALEAWIKWDGTAGDQLVIYNGDSSANGFGIKCSSGLIGVSCGGSGDAEVSAAIAANTWQHIAAVRASGTWNLYINGIPQTLNGNPSPSAPSGSSAVGSGTAGAQGFHGQTDEIRIWNTARAQADIQANMHRTLAGNESGLVAYYRFDHALGSTLADYKANHNDGVLAGSPGWTASGAVIPADTELQAQTDIRAVWNASTANMSANGLSLSGVSVGGYAAFGHNGLTGNTAADIPPGETADRLSRVWYMAVSGSVTADMIFDISDASGGLATADSYLKYILLKRSGTSGDFTVVGTGTAQDGDQITFAGMTLENGYTYTLALRPNQPPAISGLDGDASSYTEDYPAAAPDSGGDGVLTDADEVTFSGGYLLVSYTEGNTAYDQLTLAGAGGIALSGTEVQYLGTPVGDIDPGNTGQNGTNLKIIFDAPEADAAAITALIRALRFSNTNQNPSDADRVMEITVNDSEDDSVPAAVTVSVNPVNDAPVITGQVPLSTPEDTPISLSVGHLSIADLDSAAFTLSVQNSTAYTLLENNTVAPLPDFNGELTVPVAVSDGIAGSGIYNLIINVIPVDDPPVIGIPLFNLTLREDTAPMPISLAQVFTDIDSDTIIKSLVSNSNPGVLSAEIDGDTLTLTCRKDQHGTADIVIQGLSDGKTVTHGFSVTVTPEDDPPEPVTDLPDITVTDGDAQAVLNLADLFTDVDNDPAGITFTASSSDTSLVSVLLDGNTLILTYATDRAGKAFITVTATSNGITVTHTFKVTMDPQTFAVSGRTPYYSNGLAVPGTVLTLKGTNFYTGVAETFTVKTGADGAYIFEAVPRGQYILTPSKTDDPGTAGLSSDDASKIAGFALRRHTLTQDEIKLADVTGNGTVSATDASRLGRYVGGLVPAMNYTGEYWRFSPGSAEISLDADFENQDFTVTRIGDMSGNWTPGGVKRSPRDAAHLTKITAEPGEVLSVPVIFSGSPEIRGVDIAAEFDGSVLKPGEITLAGGILEYGQYELIVNTNEPGRIRIVLFAAPEYAFTGTGTFLTLNFDVTGSYGSETLLSLTQFDCNEIPVSDGNAAYRDAESAAGGFSMNGEVSHALGIGIGTEYGTAAVYDPAAYDVNGDGRTDITDAVFALREGNPGAVIRVLQYLTGIPNQGISK